MHLFERAKKIGLDSNSIDVPQATSLDGDAEGKGKTMMRIDVPMRSINAGYYPRVAALYRKLGVPLRKSDFTYSFATMAESAARDKSSLVADGKASTSSSSSSTASRVPTPSLLYEGSSGIRGFSLPSSLKRRPPSPQTSADCISPLAQAHAMLDDLTTRFNESRAYLSSVTLFALGYLYLLVVSLWHHYTGHTRDPNHPIARQTLQDYFCASSTSSHLPTLDHTFLHNILVPLFSAMMTVQASSVLRAPVADIMDYVALTFARSHLTAAAGVLEVERSISAPLDPRNVHVECLVQGLRRDKEGRIEIDVVEGSDAAVGVARTYRSFDHVILATQANQSATFVESLVEASTSSDEAEKSGLIEMLDRLRRFTYEDSQVVNHTDRSLLPLRREDWRDLNLVSPGGGVEGDSRTGSRVSSPTSSSSSPSPSRSPSRRGALASTLLANTHTMASHVLLRRPSRRHGVSSSSSSSAAAADEAEEEVLIQTTNPLLPLHPHPSTILSSSHFERAVLTMEGKAAQAGLFEWQRAPRQWTRWGWGSGRWEMELGELQGKARVWVCGSWSPGIPLLEGCVVSSGLVVRELMRGEEKMEEARRGR